MNELRKRILLELFVTPVTMIPLALGFTCFALSYVFGGVLAFLGFAAMALGFGALITNVVFNLKSISQRALKQWRSAEKQKQNQKLDSLDAKLRKTKETDDENHLRNLRELYQAFCDDTSAGRISEHTPPDMLSQIDEIFNACIHSLENSYELFKMAKRMRGDLKKGLQTQRMGMIDDVGESVSEMSRAINEVRSLKLKSKSDDLQRVRDSLSRSLRVCMNRDQARRELTDDDNALAEYAEEYDID